MATSAKVNKSLVTNVSAAACVGLGMTLPEPFRSPVTSMGLFALSGAATNWIAIHMLFERVPGFYGSGIIPLHFEEFKKGIYDLMMNQFFTAENIDRLFQGEMTQKGGVDFAPIIDETDLTPAYEALVTAVEESPLGGMLSMFGGKTALEPLRGPFAEKMASAMKHIAASDAFQKTVGEKLSAGQVSSDIVEKVSVIVRRRLDELTPLMVKEIIQAMIREHLGWLVIWGGVFGGLIGLLASTVSF